MVAGPLRSISRIATLAFLVAACGILACDAEPEGGSQPGQSDAQWTKWAASETAWNEMLEVEKRIRALEPDLAALSSDVLDLAFPGPRTRSLFADQVTWTDVAGEAQAVLPAVLDAHLGTRERSTPEATSRTAKREDLQLWPAPLERVTWLADARFKLVRGEFPPSDPSRFEGTVKFTSRARLRDGDIAWIRAEQDVQWQREMTRDGEVWRIREWHTRRFEWLRTAEPWFEDVLPSALGDEALVARARTSVHEEIVRRWLADPDGFAGPPHFFAPAMDRHPGIAVTDIDDDGFDDLYVMARHGRNLLLRNRGDGTFEEIAGRLGLDLDGHCSGAVFADFDNDGDKDVVIARTLERSVYLENREGRFAPPETGDALRYPFLASSVNAVDADGDGLLDVFFSTYAAQMVASARADAILAPYLPREDLGELMRRRDSPDHVQILNLFGPPNVMLRNRGGGRFETVDEPSLRSFMNTYQASWADYDNDGDADVYLSNDFAPNTLLRNEGDWRFSDVTEPSQTADQGFGMGVSWGDYDEDGRPDLYVSNMYSTAGRRITERFADLDPQYPKMARGNSLFRNEGSAFRRVSGVKAPALEVEVAGWSWGGQFADFDNDGDLDIYALSGYYSAPPEYALPVDT